MAEWWAIKESLDIPEVLDNLGIRVTRVDGNEHFASCPLSSHSGADANPSFSVNDSKMIYSCFSCSGSGTIPSLVMDIEGLDWDAATDWLTEFADVVADDPDAFARQIEKNLSESAEVPEGDVLPWFGMKLIKPWVQEPTDWFAERGISLETRERLQMGYDPEHTRNSYVGPAIIIPHVFQGALRGWQERWLEEPRPVWLGKYTNTDDFPKKFTLYNYDDSIKESEVIVVEGTMTVARLTQLGYNAVATFGASISDEQWKLLRGFDRVLLGFDNDAAGYKAMKAGIAALKDHTNVWVIDPPTHIQGADLADLKDDAIPKFVDAASPGFMKA